MEAAPGPQAGAAAAAAAAGGQWGGANSAIDVDVDMDDAADGKFESELLAAAMMVAVPEGLLSSRTEEVVEKYKLLKACEALPVEIIKSVDTGGWFLKRRYLKKRYSLAATYGMLQRTGVKIGKGGHTTMENVVRWALASMLHRVLTVILVISANTCAIAIVRLLLKVLPYVKMRGMVQSKAPAQHFPARGHSLCSK